MFSKFLNYIICLIFSYCPATGEEIQTLETSISNNFYVTIPHHNLAEDKIDEFYLYLKEEYSNFDNIIIISPNHFNFGGPILETIEKDGKLCFIEECINVKTINNLEKKSDFFNPVFKIDDTSKNYYTYEHGVGEHFKFINKYFPTSNVYPFVISRNTKNADKIQEIFQNNELNSLKGNNLYIASVDFSHNVEEDFALIHDMRTVASLNYGDLKGTEVDCQNCLQVLHNLAINDEKNCFEMKERTSVDTILNIKSGYNNTSHIYGEFLACEDPITTPVTGIIYGKYFGFEDISQFYQEGDLEKNPKQYYHNTLTGFDIVAFAGENNKDFKDFNIDYFIGNEKTIYNKNVRGKNIAFYTINERQIASSIKNELIENFNNTEEKIDFISEFKNKDIKLIEDGEDIYNNINNKITKEEIINELKKLKEENDIVIVFLNKLSDEKNDIVYELTEYSDMIVGIGGEIKEYERFNDTDIYHSIGNLNDYIVFEIN